MELWTEYGSPPLHPSAGLPMKKNEKFPTDRYRYWDWADAELAGAQRHQI
jgi:hypothetical protein